MRVSFGQHADVAGNGRGSRGERHPRRHGRAGTVLGLTLFLAAALALLWLAGHELAAGWRVIVTAAVIAAGLIVGLLAGRELRQSKRPQGDR